jgi:hypothetical protein
LIASLINAYLKTAGKKILSSENKIEHYEFKKSGVIVMVLVHKRMAIAGYQTKTNFRKEQ